MEIARRGYIASRKGWLEGQRGGGEVENA